MALIVAGSSPNSGRPQSGGDRAGCGSWRARWLLLCGVILVSCLGLQPAAAATVLPPSQSRSSRPVAPAPPRPNYSDRDLLVRLAPGVDRGRFAAQVQRRFGVSPKFSLRFKDYVSIRVRGPRAASRARQVAKALAKLPGVVMVRPHLILHAHATPNDPFFKNYGDPTMDPDLMDNQYYLFEVNAPPAWDLEKGSASTVIAVIDSGISVYHEDLAAKIVPGYDFVGDNAGWWTDVSFPSEDDPESEDGDATVWDPAWGQPEDHDYPGFDIFSDPSERADWFAANYDPAIGDSADNDYYPGPDHFGLADTGAAHGTVAGSLAAAATDNGLGLAGLAWNPSLMPVRVINAEGWGFGIDAADAIYYAVDHGADVLNLSWGFGPMYAIDPAEFEPGGEGYLVEQAVLYAHSQGLLIVASAGNSDNYIDPLVDDHPLHFYHDHEYFDDGLSHDGGLDFPANMPETVSVGSTNEDHLKSSFASYADPLLGEVLDITAPGESVNTGGLWDCSVWDAYNWWLFGFLGLDLPLGEDLYSADAMGTSFSAPLVSGFGALLKSRYPSITNDDFREILHTSAQDLGPDGYDVEFGYGLLNCYQGILDSDQYFQDVSPPEITGWALAATHGPVGELVCEVPDAYIEARNCGIACLVVSFSEPLDPDTIGLDPVEITGVNSGDVSSMVASLTPEGDGSVIRVTLSSALPDQDTYTVTMPATLCDPAGNPLAGDRDTVLSGLKGDANSNKTVDVGDMLAVRAWVGSTVACSTARYDANCNGTIDVGDLLAVRAHVGHTAP